MTTSFVVVSLAEKLERLVLIFFVNHTLVKSRIPEIDVVTLQHLKLSIQ